MPKEKSKESKFKQSMENVLKFQLRDMLANGSDDKKIIRRAFDSSNQLVNHPEIQHLISHVFLSVIAFKGLTTNDFNQLLRQLSKTLSCINEILEILYQNVIEDFTMDEPLSLHQMFSEGKHQDILNTVSSDLETVFGQIDMREYKNNDRLTRRMDSLARIFTLNTRVSACTAVAFYDGKLIISANLGKEEDRSLVIESLSHRFKLFCDFIKTAKDQNKRGIEDLAKKFYRSCKAGLSQPENVIVQALAKLTHAIYKDNETFNDSFRNVFLNEGDDDRFQIFLPFVDEARKPHLVISEAGDSTTDLISETLVCNNIKLIHAEQLIAWYVFISNAEHQETLKLSEESSPKFQIGISKLSCGTCWHNLSFLQHILVRGTHNNTYSHVIGLFNQDLILPVNERGITHTENSDAGSIWSETSSRASDMTMSGPKRVQSSQSPSVLDTMTYRLFSGAENRAISAAKKAQSSNAVPDQVALNLFQPSAKSKNKSSSKDRKVSFNEPESDGKQEMP